MINYNRLAGELKRDFLNFSKKITKNISLPKEMLINSNKKIILAGAAKKFERKRYFLSKNDAKVKLFLQNYFLFH